jgi:hypothetical protein
MGPFRGVPPVVAAKGDLVFEKKAESPLTLFKKLYIYTADWGVGYVQNDLEILSRGRNYVAVGYSKRWWELRPAHSPACTCWA